MGKWSQILDAEIAGVDPPPRHIRELRFPKLDGWERGRVWGRWSVEASFVTPMGTLFGGYIAALADHLMASALFTVLEDDEALSTTDLHTNFLRTVRGGVLDVEATVVHRGRRTAYCEARFSDPSGRLVARAGATQMILSSQDT